MIIKTELFKDCCNKILAATDSSEVSNITDTLELITKGKVLELHVTNNEYYASVKFPLDHEEEFHATVNAMLFLKLIAQITTEYIELTREETLIKVKGNGEYKIPLIFNDNSLLELPEIVIENKNVEMQVSGTILQSILDYNSKELTRGTAVKNSQNMYYVDDKGCITYRSSSCVNKFNLEKPIKLLLNNRLVKLFKLFKNDIVNFTLGHDPLSDEIIQTKVSFETESIKLTAIVSCDDTTLNEIKVDFMRSLTDFSSDTSVVFNKDALLQAVNRLLLFCAGYGSKEIIKPYSLLEFKQDKVIIWDAGRDNKEEILYANGTKVNSDINITLDLTDIKAVLSYCPEDYVTLSYGSDKAIVIKRGDIYNIIPRVRSAVGTVNA